MPTLEASGVNKASPRQLISQNSYKLL